MRAEPLRERKGGLAVEAIDDLGNTAAPVEGGVLGLAIRPWGSWRTTEAIEHNARGRQIRVSRRK
jgi:hypothetical protein